MSENVQRVVDSIEETLVDIQLRGAYRELEGNAAWREVRNHMDRVMENAKDSVIEDGSDGAEGTMINITRRRAEYRALKEVVEWYESRKAELERE
jgi:hypothetical protein